MARAREDPSLHFVALRMARPKSSGNSVVMAPQAFAIATAISIDANARDSERREESSLVLVLHATECLRY